MRIEKEDMEKIQVKMGPCASLIVGPVLTALGGLFLLTGLMFLFMGQMERVTLVLLSTFGLVGLSMLCAGVTVLVLYAKKKKQLQAVVDAGRYFFAEVINVDTNFNVMIMGRHPIRLIAKMEDPMGTVHTFKSRDLMLTYVPDLVGKQVRIYAQQGNLDNYYMYTDPLTNMVREH